jgi:hypothetical protein
MNRNTLIVAAIAAIVVFAVGKAQTESGNAQTGRYQLFSGEHDLLGSTLTEKAILRLDTATGNVDQWVRGADGNGGHVDRWMRTGNLVPSR